MVSRKAALVVRKDGELMAQAALVVQQKYQATIVVKKDGAIVGSSNSYTKSLRVKGS